MKKILFGTTALVGATFAASAAFAAPEVRLGGFFNFQLGMSSQNLDGFGTAPGVPGTLNDDGYAFVTDTEIIISATDKLDNGLAWTVTIELEADSQDRANDDVGPENADEVNLALTGTWGRLILGNDDGAADNTRRIVSRGAVSGLGVNGMGGWRRWIRQGVAGVAADGGGVYNANDSTKVIYFTPRVSGFQFGVSFAPDDQTSGRSRAPAGNAGGTGDYNNAIEANLNFETKFDDFTLGLEVVGAHADAKREANNDMRAIGFGASLAFGGFTLSAGYGQANVAASTTTVAANNGRETTGYSLQGKYATGPYEIGLGWAHKLLERPNTADYESDQFAVTGGYRVAPGMVTYVDVARFSDDNPANRALENEGYSIVTGVNIQF